MRRLAASASMALRSTAVSSASRPSRTALAALHHDGLCELPDVVAEDAVGLQIDRGDRQRGRELDLELAERLRADRAAEARDARLADAGALGKLGNRQPGRQLEILAHSLRDAPLGRAQVVFDALDTRDNVDRRSGAVARPAISASFQLLHRASPSRGKRSVGAPEIKLHNSWAATSRSAATPRCPQEGRATRAK